MSAVNNGWMSMTRSVEELEIKVAFLEDALAKLSDEFYLQQRDIESLKAQQVALIEKINTSSNQDEGREQILDERPPHY